MTYSLINKCAKNYYNRTFIVPVIAKNVVTCFFLRHSVYKRYTKSMEKPDSRPTLLLHFQPIFLKLKTKKDIRDTTLHVKFEVSICSGLAAILNAILLRAPNYRIVS